MKLFLFLILIISPISIVNVFACSCVPLPPIYQAFNDADVVFSGKAVSMREVSFDDKVIKGDENINSFFIKERIYQFQIKEGFKNVQGQKIDVNASALHTSCEIGFKVGEEYLVYGYESNGKFFRSFCSRTKSLDYAENQIYFIRKLLNGEPEPQIYGSVTRLDLNSFAYKNRPVALSGIKINIEDQDGKIIQTTTNKFGMFSIKKLPVGEYNIKPILPPNYDEPYENNARILINEINGVSFPNSLDFYNGLFYDFKTRWENKVSGTVTDAEGKIIENAKVSLVPISNPNVKIISRDYFNRLNQGEYSIYGHTLGKYYLVAEVDYPTKTSDKFRLFFPQTTTPDGALIINLKQKDNLKYDIRLPFNLRKLSGKIFWEDSTQVTENLVVYLTNSKEINSIETSIEDTRLSKDGSFSFVGFEGTSYWIHAVIYTNMSEDGVIEQINTKPTEIKLGKEDQSFKIVLPKPEQLKLAN